MVSFRERIKIEPWPDLGLKFFILAFSRTGKSWKKATGPGKFSKSVKLNKKISSVWKAIRRINIEILGV